MYYYENKADDTKLSCPDWRTLKSAIEDDDSAVFNLNFVYIDGEKNVEVRFAPNEDLSDGVLEAADVPAAIAYDLKARCLDIIQYFAEEEDDMESCYMDAKVKTIGKYYRATLESPEEWPDLEYYCDYCNAAIGYNEEFGDIYRCPKCGQVNRIPIPA